MNLMRLANVIVLIGAVIPIVAFLIGFRGSKGYNGVAQMLRWQAASVVLLIAAPLAVNWLNLDTPLNTTNAEQFFTLGTRIFAAIGAWVLLVTWLKLRRTPVTKMNRRSTDRP